MTKSEHIEINSFCKRKLKHWQKIISPNIVGVHFGKKMKEANGKFLNRNAIVFHIEQKFSHPQKLIPKLITVKFKSGKTKVFPSDVIETGITKLLSVRPGDKASVRGKENVFGAAGLFFKKNGRLYVCSNMHVLAPQYLSDGYYYRPVSEQNERNVSCFTESKVIRGFLEEGSFRGIDIAIARFPDEYEIDNSVKGIGYQTGVIDSSLIIGGLSIKFYSPVLEKVVTGVVKNTSISKIVRFGNINVQIDDLVQAALPANYGDSGSFVFTKYNKVVGMLVSIDEGSTYFISIQKILKFINPDNN